MYMTIKSTIYITQAAIIAAIYTLLVVLFAPISFGPIQTRVAEALTILPYFTPAAIPGVTIGCFLSAIISGADILDIIFGPLATLIGAILSYKLRRNKYLVPIPPILANAIIIPWVLKFAYGEAQPIPFMMLTVGLGEVLTAGLMGIVLLFALDRVKNYIFKTE
ncbi:MAG: QueT transporter family protein [Clostridiales bacterium]|nr:QueT transporter family protein [Clostridiales bacterium]